MNRKSEAEIMAGMVGRTFAEVTGSVGDEVMRFVDADGRGVRFYHEQSCCENVLIEDVCGDIADLIGSPILLAEAVSNMNGPELPDADSYTWTFYKFATIKGSVTVRWLGTSNGYYGEDVAVEELP